MLYDGNHVHAGPQPWPEIEDDEEYIAERISRSPTCRRINREAREERERRMRDESVVTQ